MLKLIRAFLNAGVLEDGLVRPVDEGTPQGGPLSPFLSNIVLDDLDKELARRGHQFCRYADDCNIYVRSHHAGERVTASISRFLTDKLRLKVNEAKKRARDQFAADDRRPHAIPHRMVRVLRLLSDPARATILRQATMQRVNFNAVWHTDSHDKFPYFYGLLLRIV